MAKYFGIGRYYYEEPIRVPIQNFNTLGDCLAYWSQMFFEADSNLEYSALHDDYSWIDYVTFYVVNENGVRQCEEMSRNKIKEIN